MTEEWTAERMDAVISTLNEEQLELFGIVMALYLRAENAANLAMKQAQRLFVLLQEEPYDPTADWKEHDHDWGVETQDSIDAESGEDADRPTDDRQQLDDDVGSSMDKCPEDRSEGHPFGGIL